MSSEGGLNRWGWLLFDGAVWLTIMGLCLLMRFRGHIPPAEWEFFYRFVPIAGSGMLVSLYRRGIYDPNPTGEMPWGDFGWGWLTGIGISFAILFLLKIPYSRVAFTTASVLYLPAIVAGRLVVRWIVGGRRNRSPVDVVALGFTDPDRRHVLTDRLPARFRFLFRDFEDPDPSFQWLQDRDPDLVILDGQDLSDETMNQVAAFACRHQIPVRIFPTTGDLFLAQTAREVWNELLLLRSDRHHSLHQQIALKSLFDHVIGALLLLVSLPLMLLVSAVVVLDSGFPVLFRQERTGRGGEPFTVFKFRTMVPDASETGPELTQGPDDPRITRAGRWLRRWSLDELPQLLNVLRGEMSLVGPRPEIPSITRDYSPEQRRVFWMKPGLTGLSQVSGREELKLREKLQIDQYYLREYSILMDVWILVRTLVTVIRGEGTN